MAKLNRKSQDRINRSIELIAETLKTFNNLSTGDVKFLLRRNNLYETIQDVTLKRIGDWGQDRGLYRFDSQYFYSLCDTFNSEPLIDKDDTADDIAVYFEDTPLEDKTYEKSSLSLSDNLINQVVCSAPNGEMLWIPRLIADRALQLCSDPGGFKELAGLIKLYFSS